MSTWQIILWLVLMFVGFGASALFAGMEIGSYSLNRVRLQIFQHQRHRGARILSRMVNNPVSLLTTLLAGTNIASYLGTAAVAVFMQAGGLSDWETIALNTIIVTPILFIFCETLPKDLFAAHADALMYRLAFVLEFFRRLFTYIGLVPLIGLLIRGVMRLLGQRGTIHPFHPRRQVQALVKQGVGYGLLSDEQSAIVERVLNLASRRLRDEMTPWSRTLTIAVDAPPGKLWELADRTSHSRFPIVQADGRVAGVVHVMDALKLGRDNCPPIRELMRPPTFLAAKLPLRQALAELQKQQSGMAIVVDAHQRPLGVATVKDLVEAITGELASW